MKKLIFLITLFSLFLLTQKNASAHLVGQTPYFKVNGVYSGFYNVPSTSLNNFNLPQDAGPDTYLVGNPISFEIDKFQLPVPIDIVAKTTFNWDFGDGTTGTGFANTHSYQRQGSYILQIYASYVDVGQKITPQLLQSIMINIVKDKSYVLPKSVIKVNDKGVKDPIADVLDFNPKDNLIFDGSDSASQSKIVEFFWDFGDQKSASGQIVNHTYGNTGQIVFPLLRIKNEDGFIADGYLEINNDSKNPVSKVSKVVEKNSTNIAAILFIAASVIVFISISLYIIKKRR